MTNRERHEQVLGFMAIAESTARARDARQRGDEEELSRQLEGILEAVRATAPPVSVSEAAALFQVSAPTVRQWLKRGLLQRAGIAKPIRLEFESVADLADGLRRLRELAGDERRWTALLRQAADQRVLNEPGVHESLREALALPPA